MDMGRHGPAWHNAAIVQQRRLGDGDVGLGQDRDASLSAPCRGGQRGAPDATPASVLGVTLHLRELVRACVVLLRDDHVTAAVDE
eukprot:6873666-Pyramimonas_sp.AAC.1